MIVLSALHLRLYCSIAHIAQSVEHFLGKEEVTGSNPVVGSNSGGGLILEGGERSVKTARMIKQK